jgi:hypothetical protein
VRRAKERNPSDIRIIQEFYCDHQKQVQLTRYLVIRLFGSVIIRSPTARRQKVLTLRSLSSSDQEKDAAYNSLTELVMRSPTYSRADPVDIRAFHFLDLKVYQKKSAGA